MEGIYFILGEVGTYIPLLPFFIALYKFKSYNPAFKSICLMVFIETGVNLYSVYQFDRGINNLPSLHLLTALEFFFAATFFYLIFNSKKLKVACFLISLAFLIYTLSNTTFFQSIYEYNSLARGTQALILCLFALLYFYELVNKKVVISVDQIPEFWIVSGILLFFASVQFFALFFPYYLIIYKSFGEHDTMRYLIRSISLVASIIYYPFLAVGLWKKK